MAKKRDTNGNGNDGTAVAEPTKRKPELRRFRLKKDVGSHFEPNRDFDSDLPEGPGNLREIEYVPGQVVKSYRDLTKVFENKFIAYDSMGRAIAEDDDIDPDTENDEARKENLKLSQEADERAADDPVGSEQRANSGLSSEQRRKQLEEELAEEGDDEDLDPVALRARKRAEKEGLGDDVSDDFDLDDEAGFKVFKKGTSYYVTDADNHTRPLTSRKGIKRVEVGRFLKKKQAAKKRAEDE